MNQVITFGEAMVRFTPPVYRRLEQTRTLEVFIGGAELNTSVALARFGTKVAWVSRLTNNELGRMIAGQAREAGVNDGHILWTDEDRVGLYFFELAGAPRANNVIYDRKGSAISMVTSGMFQWKEIFAGARWFHVSGITPALSPTTAQVTTEALRTAKEAGLTVSFDLNYRSKLWSEAEASHWMKDNMQYCDLVCTGKKDAKNMLELEGDSPEEVAKDLRKKFGVKMVAMPKRKGKRQWKNSYTVNLYTKDGTVSTASYDIDVVDRLGAGDAFVGGFIHGMLTTGDPQQSLDLGVASGAFKHTIPGDFSCFTPTEIQTLLAGKSGGTSR